MRDLIKTKEPRDEDQRVKEQFRIILDYNVQSKKVENIIKKYWNILQRDKLLCKVLPPQPRFVYKKAPALRKILAPSVIDPLKRDKGNRPNPFGTTLVVNAKRAGLRKIIIRKKKEFTSTSTGKSYALKDFITCSTKGVVYMLKCSCGIQYVGRTSRELLCCI